MTQEKKTALINKYTNDFAPEVNDSPESKIANTYYRSGMTAAFQIIGDKYDSNTLKQLRNRFQHADSLKVVLGAGDVWYGRRWIETNQEDLDILVREDWEYFFGDKKADYMLAEHVWEHFTEEQAMLGFRNVHAFLKDTGNFRIAVPDGHFPNQDYIDAVKPGGIGAGADDHKILYTVEKLLKMLDQIPFRTTALEYFDKKGTFHYLDWDTYQGKISRSRFFDDRNTDDQIVYSSIIIDCKK